MRQTVRVSKSLLPAELGDTFLRSQQATRWPTLAPPPDRRPTFGRRGGGLGEYVDSDGGLAVLADGRIVLRDPGNARFTVYGSDGKYLESWPAHGGTYTSTPIFPTADGGLYSPEMILRCESRLANLTYTVLRRRALSGQEI